MLELIVDESAFTQLVNIEPQYGSLKISNPSDIQVDADALIEHLKQMEGINRVEQLTIGYNSSLKDLGVLRAFVNLKYLFVYGQNIKSFEGIEWFSKGVCKACMRLSFSMPFTLR